MEIVRRGRKDDMTNLYPEEYEFKLCGGSVEPKDATLIGRHDIDAEESRSLD